MIRTKNYTDEALIEAILNKTELNEAISFLYQSHYRLLERHILTNSGNAMDAEDLIQEVMVAFIEIVQQGKYRAEASVKSFLFTLMRNLWITELRKRDATQKRHERYETERETWDEDVSSFLTYKEAQKTVVALFERLGEKCRKILTLFYYEDLSMKEILTQTEYENEQVLRNKKYKCLKEMTDMVQSNPSTFENVKSALERLR
jgi:RNA polymerase sigma factor (sigma-70 family)